MRAEKKNEVKVTSTKMAGKEDRSLVLPRKIARNWEEINLAEAMKKITDI